MQDIAISTGGTLINDEIGLTLENADESCFGQCKKVIVTKDDTMIMGGLGDSKEVHERIESLRNQIEQTTSEYEKEKMQERLGKLTGGIAVIKVGGASEVEVGELRD